MKEDAATEHMLAEPAVRGSAILFCRGSGNGPDQMANPPVVRQWLHPGSVADTSALKKRVGVLPALPDNRVGENAAGRN